MLRFLRSLGRVVLTLLLLALAAFAFLVFQIDRLGRQDHAQPADAIVVLGARVNPDGSPGSDLTSRTLHAVDLWQAGYAPRLICSGGFKAERLSAAAVCRRYASSLGVPADVIFLADGTSNTIEDAQATAALMTAQGWRSAILVSHPLHLFRTRWLFRREGVTVATSPTTTETSRIFLPLRIWYAVREAAAIVTTALDAWDLFPRAWWTRLHDWTYTQQ